MTRLFQIIALAAGLAVLCWIGGSHLGNPLALAVTVLIGVFYIVGAVELLRYERATATLIEAQAQLTAAPATLDGWLERLDASLRPAVRLRIEGERLALPGPVLAPYLAGLVVLLGMLGTFLGMVVTLNGTGTALQGAADLPTIRDALSAPVRGLGLAFGTSVAGVAASAMLGLASALCRRDRSLASRALDARIATTLRPFSLAHQRDEAFRSQQQQAAAMPELLGQLQAMVASMERQQQTLGERLASGQDTFHSQTEAAYGRLAASVDQSLQRSLAESARIAGATIAPMAEAATAGIAREAAALHEKVAQTVAQQLDDVARGFERTTSQVSATWSEAIGAQQRANEAQAGALRQALAEFNTAFGQRAATMVDDVARRLDDTVTTVATQWRGALAQQEETVGRLTSDSGKALNDSAAAFAQQGTALLEGMHEAHVRLQDTLASGDAQRLSAWTASLQAMATSLQQAWQQAGADSAQHQQQLRDELTQTVRELTTQTATQATRTVDEISGLLQAAAEAPRAAAGAMAELRQKLSDSMARDNAMLEERTRLLETLGTLLDAVNHSATEQRSAVDAMVAGSADMLERVGGRFSQQVEAQTDRLTEVAAQMTGSAVEVASLGDAFGHAVQLFSQSNSALVEHLQRIEDALGKSMARSDEQLAYYVAQAREVIDLSLMSQKQVVDDLQRLAANQATAGAAA